MYVLMYKAFNVENYFSMKIFFHILGAQVSTTLDYIA